jgi:ribosomal-protein-alanine N-acetyltransferase
MEKKSLIGFADNIKVETERLILRPVTMKDAPDMFEYGKNPNVAKFVFPVHDSLESSREVIATLMMQKPLGNWGIEFKENHKFIGTISFPRVDFHEKTAEVGYILSETYWGKGIMTEAMRAVLKIGFEACGFKTIFAEFDVANPASGRVMEKAGMIRGGTVKKSDPMSHQMKNFTRYELTSSEYFAKSAEVPEPIFDSLPNYDPWLDEDFYFH